MFIPKRLPWLRYMEGTEGNQAGGDGGAGKSAGDAGSGAGGDGSDNKSAEGHGAGKGNDEISPAAQKIIDAIQEEKKKSEPAPQEKPGEKADTPSLEDLINQVSEQQKVIDALKESDAKAAEERRSNLAAEVAKDAKLPESLASRLTGDTREQMEADAADLAKSFGSLLVDPGQGQGGGQGGNPQMTMSEAIDAYYAVNK